MDLLKTVACSYGTANLLWISAIIPCLNLQINLSPSPCPPPSTLSLFKEHPHCLYQGCTPLQRGTVTAFLQFRSLAKNHHLKLVASDLLRVYYCTD